MSEIKPNLIKPRWSKVISDLWDNKTRTLLVVSSIAVGVFSIGMIMTAYAILGNDMNASFAAQNPAHIDITTDLFDDDFIRVIQRVEGVASVEGRRTISVRGTNDDITWQSLKIIAVDDFETMGANLLGAHEGAQSPGVREMVVTENFMITSGYEVGDMIKIELPDGSTHTLPLVGLVIDQVTDSGDVAAVPNLYVTRETLKSLGMTDDFNHLYVRVTGTGGNEAFIETVAELIEDRIERNNRNVYRTKTQISTKHPMASMILAVLGVLGALGGLIMVLSSSLIINTLNALLTQHMRQIGIMKLIGGRSTQILGMYMSLIFSYGVIALATAIPLGAAAGYGLASFMADMLGSKLLGFRFIPAAIIAQTLLSFLIPIGAGFFPVNKGSKINVRQAISNDRPIAQSDKTSLFDRLISFLSWISRPILLSIRNTFRQKGRLLLTIFTLTIAGSIFIAVFNVRDSMENMMDMLFAHFMGDVTIGFSEPYPISRIEQIVLPIPGVAGLEGWGGARAAVWDENDDVVVSFNIVAAPHDTELLKVDMIAGRWLEPGEENAVVMADSIFDTYPDLEPGDKLLVKMPGHLEEDWEIVGIFRFVSMVGDPLAYADFDFIADQTNTQSQSMSYRVITKEHTRESQLAISNFLDEYLKDRGFNISGVEAGIQLQEDNTKSINIMVVFLLIMALLTAVVGSIGLTGTMGMNVLERTREIGVMRAIGAVDFEIIKSVVIEGVIIGLITWVLAIGVSFPISAALLNIISTSMMGSSMELVFTAQGIVYWLGVVIGLSFFASILPARNASRLTIREVLSYE